MNAYTKLTFALSRIKTASKADKLLRAGKLLPSSVARLLGKVNLNKWGGTAEDAHLAIKYNTPRGAGQPWWMHEVLAEWGLRGMQDSASKSLLTSSPFPEVDWRDALPIIRKGRAKPNNPWASMTPNVKSPNPVVQSMVDFSRNGLIRPLKMHDRITPNLTRDVNLSARYIPDTHTVNLPPGYDTKMTVGHELGHAIGYNTPTFQRANNMLDADRYLQKFAPTTHKALLTAYPGTTDTACFRGELEAQWLATRSKANSSARIRDNASFLNTNPLVQERIKNLDTPSWAAISEAVTNDPSGRARALATQLIINHGMPVN